MMRSQIPRRLFGYVTTPKEIREIPKPGDMPTSKRLSDGISSQALFEWDDHRSWSPLTYMQSHRKTKRSLHEIRTQFQDFDDYGWPLQAKQIFDSLYFALEFQEDVTIMKSLSVPLYDQYKSGVKLNPNYLLENLDQKIVDVIIAQARLYRADTTGDEKINRDWYQIKCEFVFSDKVTAKDVTKFIGFERRPIDKVQKNWRIFYFED